MSDVCGRCGFEHGEEEDERCTVPRAVPREMMVVRAPEPSYDTRLVEVERCADCGEIVLVGGWPYCKSPRNPGGHSVHVAYGFSMGGGLRAWHNTGTTRRGM